MLGQPLHRRYALYSRRSVIKSLLAAPLILTSRGVSRGQDPPSLLDVRRQKQFVNQLPRPARAMPRPGTRHYEVAVRQFRGWLGLADPRTGQRIETTLWGHESQYPGPTFDVRRRVRDRTVDPTHSAPAGNHYLICCPWTAPFTWRTSPGVRWPAFRS